MSKALFANRKAVSQPSEVEALRVALAESHADAAAVSQVMKSILSASTRGSAIQATMDTVRGSFGWAYRRFWQLDHSDRALRFFVESGDAGAQSVNNASRGSVETTANMQSLAHDFESFVDASKK